VGDWAVGDWAVGDWAVGDWAVVLQVEWRQDGGIWWAQPGTWHEQCSGRCRAVMLMSCAKHAAALC
jgi:hypothetical protein